MNLTLRFAGRDAPQYVVLNDVEVFRVPPLTGSLGFCPSVYGPELLQSLTAVGLKDPSNVAVGPNGGVYVSDTDCSQPRVLQFNPQIGVVQILTSPDLYYPLGLAVDSALNVYCGEAH